MLLKIVVSMLKEAADEILYVKCMWKDCVLFYMPTVRAISCQGSTELILIVGDYRR